MSVEATLARWNAFDSESLERELLDACGAWRWARALAGARPFASADALFAAAERAFDALEPLDWLEAFAAHPEIGGAAGAGHQSGRGRAFSESEQSGAAPASSGLAERLARGNRDYRERFGWIFLVRAAGRTAEQVLAELERRLGNDSERELAEAAGEQRAITRLRLERMLDP